VHIKDYCTSGSIHTVKGCAQLLAGVFVRDVRNGSHVELISTSLNSIHLLVVFSKKLLKRT